MQHLMIDLETWATGQDAAIRAIAMLAFDPAEGSVQTALLIDLTGNIDRQLETGRKVESGTVHWWQKQPQPLTHYIATHRRAPAVNLVIDEPASPLVAIDTINKMIRQTAAIDADYRVWARGSFDPMIIRHLYSQYELAAPWEYWRERDVRTLDEIVSKVRPGTPHDPISDTEAQIRQVAAAYRMKKEAA